MAITVTTSFSESNLSIPNNTSSLTVNIYFSPNNTQTWFQSATLYCRVNGTTQSKTVSLSKGGSVSTSFTFNNIAHNDDGTKSVDWSWSCSTGTSVLGDLYRSGTKTLTTIPRYSDITCASPVDMGTTQSVEITQKSDTFSHILFYKTSLDSDYTKLGRGTATATYSWTLPNIATQLPNVTFDNYTLLCRTYTNTNYEGEPLESTLNVQANIPSSYVPTITIDNISEGNTNIPSGWPYVAGHSKLNVRTRFTGSANSTVVSRAVKVGNETITSDNATPLVEMSFTQPLMATSNQVYASTVDSRGRTGSASQNVQAVAYASPTIAIDVTRCQQDGTIDAMGEYALVRAKWSWTDVNNLNSASIKINVDGTLATTYQTTTNSQTTWKQIAILPNILATNDYTIQVVIQDALASSKVSQTVTKATLPFSLFDDGNELGASFGRMATSKGWNFYDDNLEVNNGNIYATKSNGYGVVMARSNAGNAYLLTETTNAGKRGLYGVASDNTTGGWLIYADQNADVVIPKSLTLGGSSFTITNPTAFKQALDLDDVYSTSEVKTNKVWIDDKPIYRRVFRHTGSTITISANTWTNTNISNSNMNAIINCFVVSRNGTYSPFWSARDSGSYVRLLSPRYSEIVANDFIVLEYTKTSD